MGQPCGWFWNPQTIRGERGATPNIPPKEAQKLKISIITWVSPHQSIDNGILGPWVPKKMQPNNGWTQMSNLSPKNFLNGQKWPYLDKRFCVERARSKGFYTYKYSP